MASPIEQKGEQMESDKIKRSPLLKLILCLLDCVKNWWKDVKMIWFNKKCLLLCKKVRNFSEEILCYLRFLSVQSAKPLIAAVSCQANRQQVILFFSYPRYLKYKQKRNGFFGFLLKLQIHECQVRVNAKRIIGIFHLICHWCIMFYEINVKGWIFIGEILLFP